jgi:hypothetical protein
MDEPTLASAAHPPAHPPDGAFEAFVIGALEGGDAEAFEAHVLGCAACGLRLREEASLEERIHEVAAKPRAPLAEVRSMPTKPGRRRTAVVVGGVLAVAAALALVVLERPPVQEARAPELAPSPRPSAIPAVVCDSLTDQAACIERAHRRGLYVKYPSGAGAPPIGGASTVGPSSSPFPISKRDD